MKRVSGSWWRLVYALVWGTGVLVLAGGCGEAGSGGEKELEVAVVSKGGATAFWESIREGAMAAAAEWEAAGQPVTFHWKRPEEGGDPALQTALLERAVEGGVDGVILAPVDRKALVEPVEAALRSGIATVIIASELDSGETVSLVATDSFRAGAAAGEELAKRLGGEGQVILLRYRNGPAMTEDREAGFLYALGGYPGMEVVSKKYHTGSSVESAYRASEKVLRESGHAVDGVFAAEASLTRGMLLALRETGLAGEVVFVGMGPARGPEIAGALRRGEIAALVKEDPFRMGQVAVEVLVRHLRGESVQEFVDTGFRIVTAASGRAQPEE